MEWIRTWLLTVTCAALITTLAVSLTPEGFPRRLAKFAGGLLLLLVVLGPVKELDLDDISGIFSKYRNEYRDQRAFSEVDQEQIKTIIEEQTAAYISDKARAVGIESCSVTVHCCITDEGYPAPEWAKVRGIGAADAWQALRHTVAADFGLEGEALEFERVEVP